MEKWKIDCKPCNGIDIIFSIFSYSIFPVEYLIYNKCLIQFVEVDSYENNTVNLLTHILHSTTNNMVKV
jgi:hypothetical protein